MFSLRNIRVSAAATIALMGALASSAASAASNIDGEFMAKVANANRDIPAPALKIAYQFLKKHESSFENKEYMTIIDFDLPSNQQRLYLINLRSGDVTRYYVAHGYGSGDVQPSRFSNSEGSGMTSLGVYKTAEYNRDTSHRIALRVRGLQSTNSNAYSRDIEIHDADYVRPGYIRSNGRAGHSAGCFAMDPSLIGDYLQKVDGGSLVLAYYRTMAGEAN